MKIRTMLQGFEWYLPADGEQKNYFNHPNRIAWTRDNGWAKFLVSTSSVSVWVPRE